MGWACDIKKKEEKVFGLWFSVEQPMKVVAETT
jgi:hypothetical protein